MHDGFENSSARGMKSVRERDLDNFLLEELRASASFRSWFLRHLTDCLDIPPHSSVKIGKNPKREVASGQTDLSFALCDEQGVELALILIESKVGSGFEQGQPERYREEVEAARARLGRRSAAAVLIAPERNKPVLDHPCFAASIRLEAIIDHLRARFDSCNADTSLALELRERLTVRIDLLNALARKRSYTGNWTPNPVPGRLDFFEQYRTLAAQFAPQFKATDSSGGWKAKTMLFTVPPIPGLGIKNIRHNFRSGVSLVLPKAAKAERQIREAGILPQGAAVESTRIGTLLIRLRTPTIDPSGSLFEAQRSAIENSIASVIALYAWAKERAADLVTILRSAYG